MKWWQRLLRPTPPGFVLFLLCLICLITYVDRVNIATAASDIRRELSLTATQYGLIFSVFGYPYLAFRCSGVGRRSIRTAQDVVHLRSGLGRRDDSDWLAGNGQPSLYAGSARCR